MGATRGAIVHYYDECLKCNYRDSHDCTYKKRVKEKCVWYRKKRNGYTLEEPKQTKCPLKDEENKKKMNRKELLDAISQNYRESLQDIGVTNGEVITAMFPNATISKIKSETERTKIAVEWHFVDIPSYYNLFYEDWWNAPYKAEKEE